jgi:cellulose synthase operon protein C
MPKEALTIWENRAQMAPGLPPESDYCALLLKLGRVESVAGLCRRWADRLDAADLTALRSHLAAHHLGGAATVADTLPADDPILLQGPAASRALDAYCAGDDAALAEALAAIPFRSPYRDLAQILKALQRLPEAPDEAASGLARVGDQSGFAPLRRAGELGLEGLGGRSGPGPERLAGAGAAARRFALTLAGWGEERQALWEEVRRTPELGPSSLPQALLRLLHRHRARLGEDWARRQALRLLVPGFPKSAGWITQGGARRLSEEERLLVAAWRAEDAADPWQELQAWKAYYRQLLTAGTPEPGSDGALRLALILRRADSHLGILAQATPSGDPMSPGAALAEALELSLHHDPEDRDTCERLIRYFLRGKDLKSARRILEPALQRFPRDAGLLTAALDLALASDSFKKAARYAREVLAVDPINTGARERLVKAHLAHARKQIRGGRPDLARKELAEAAEWEPKSGQAGRLGEQRAVLGALLELGEDPEAGRAALQHQAAALGGGISAAFALALECESCGRPQAATLKVAGLAKVPVPNQAALGAFLGRLRAHLEGAEGLARPVRTLIESPLRNAAGWPLPQGECESACETLRRARLPRARQAFAEAALRRWPGNPVFVLHAFEARQESGTRYPSDADLDRLEAAWQRAQSSGDQRTAHRIGEIIRSLSPFGLPPLGPGRGPTFVFDDDDGRGCGPGPDRDRPRGGPDGCSSSSWVWIGSWT